MYFTVLMQAHTINTPCVIQWRYWTSV